VAGGVTGGIVVRGFITGRIVTRGYAEYIKPKVPIYRPPTVSVDYIYLKAMLPWYIELFPDLVIDQLFMERIVRETFHVSDGTDMQILAAATSIAMESKIRTEISCSDIHEYGHISKDIKLKTQLLREEE
jgi:hypothetical protein